MRAPRNLPPHRRTPTRRLALGMPAILSKESIDENRY